MATLLQVLADKALHEERRIDGLHVHASLCWVKAVALGLEHHLVDEDNPGGENIATVSQ